MPTASPLPPAAAPRVPSRVETRRLVLRPYAREDGPALFEAVRESVARLRPWLPWADLHPDAAASTATCERLRDAFERGVDFTLGVFDRAGGRLLGGTGLHRFRPDVGSFEIGYWLRTTAQGRGYVTESTAALATVCFETLGAERVEVFCDPDNVASRRVAERAGFLHEGTMRRCRLGTDGALRDRAVYALVRPDWERDGARIAALAFDRPAGAPGSPARPQGPRR